MGASLFFSKFSSHKKIEEDPERGKIIYSKTFKNGINPQVSKESYRKIFEEVQNLVKIPVKYPLELPQDYKLFQVIVFQKAQGAEEIEIYFDKNYESFLEESTKYIPGKKSYSEHGYVGFNDKKYTILLRETFIQPPFYFKNFYIPPDQIKEITLANGEKTILIKYTGIDESSGNVKFSNNLYLGYSQKNQKKYYYLIESNISEKEILNFANGIIKNEKNE